ncbi:MAG: phosphodiester glycosidase family protein [Actinobacteria bacterium]|nr:phosphodiester glycosidase family protein [Actinomycetota bacterium]
MLGRILIVCLAAGIVALPAGGAGLVLILPGVTYERQVQYTRHGPVVVHVMTAPRPGGQYELRPLLSNNAIPGVERLTAMQRRTPANTTLAGISGDESVAGTFFQSGVLQSLPVAGRTTIAIDAQGILRIERVSVFATWAGAGQRRPGLLLNQQPGPNGASLYTPAFGPTTPAGVETVEAVIAGMPPVTPNSDLAGRVVEISPGSGKRIPPDGAVLVARGSAAGRLAAEAPLGATVTARFLTSSLPAGVVHAVGGGPTLVRGGRPVFRSGEQFSVNELALRQARGAIGQRADGRILFVAVDGGQPGYSTGLTNYELAQTMVRLGAATAAGTTVGRATTMASEGKLLNRPQFGERAVSDALVISYTAPPAPK